MCVFPGCSLAGASSPSSARPQVLWAAVFAPLAVFFSISRLVSARICPVGILRRRGVIYASRSPLCGVRSMCVFRHGFTRWAVSVVPLGLPPCSRVAAQLVLTSLVRCEVLFTRDHPCWLSHGVVGYPLCGSASSSWARSIVAARVSLVSDVSALLSLLPLSWLRLFPGSSALLCAGIWPLPPGVFSAFWPSALLGRWRAPSR